MGDQDEDIEHFAERSASPNEEDPWTMAAPTQVFGQFDRQGPTVKTHEDATLPLAPGQQVFVRGPEW
jgi:hypothetical protein